MATLWGGRFQDGPEASFAQLNQSLGFDRRLLTYDLKGSLAYAEALHGAKVLNEDEYQSIKDGLTSLQTDWQNQPERINAAIDEAIAQGIEDVHSFVELELKRRIGEPALKLHTGRSRNEQVSLDMRLFVADKTRSIIEQISFCRKKIAALAERYAADPMPGYTHLQRAQPVTWGHYLLSWAAMLERDGSRMRDSLSRTESSPLGCGSLSGNPWPLDLHSLAKRLELPQICSNSIDATSDRDFVLEWLSNGAISMMHLSRIAEDLILFASTEFGLVSLGDAICTGSSLMPQKKNPDALELLRGKAGRMQAHFQSLLTTMKGLPSAYNKDLQEDKPALLDAVDTWELCLEVFAVVLDHVTPQVERSLEACSGGYLDATELADYLVSLGIPFRRAHDVVGKVVSYAAGKSKALVELSLEEFRQFHADIDDQVYSYLSIQRALEVRNRPNGTAPEQVRLQAQKIQTEP